MAKFVLILCSLVAISAHATGGVSCKADDQNLKFEFGSATSRGLGSAILNAMATLEVKKSQGPVNIVIPTLTKDNVVQYWNNDKQLNLFMVWVNSEGDYNAEVELKIATKLHKKSGEFRGSYELKTYLTSPMLAEMESEGYKPTRIVKGSVVCDLE